MLKTLISKIKSSPSFRVTEARFSRKLQKARKIFGLLAIAMFLVQITFAFGLPTLAADYDANAVIYGGCYSLSDLVNHIQSGSDGVNSDIGTIFGTIGIYPADVWRMSEGTVTKAGNVYVGGVLKASGVYSSGRSYMSGSVKDPRLPIYWRPPSVSFRSNSLSAFVHLDGNGNFVYAVLKSCGNPVARYTCARFGPNLTFNKYVLNSSRGETSWRNATNAAVDNTLSYRLVAANTGPVSALSVNITDSMPADLTFVSGSGPSSLFSGGYGVGNIYPGDSKAVSYQARVDASGEGKTLTNTAAAQGTNTIRITDRASVVVDNVVVTRPHLMVYHEVANLTQQEAAYVKSNIGNPNDLLTYRVSISNTGNATARNVIVRDTMPSTITYVQGSTRIFNTANPNGLNLADGITGSGINIGNIVPGNAGFTRIRFWARIIPGITQTTQIVNTVTVQASNVSAASDQATTLVRIAAPNLILSKSAYNITRARDATTIAAQPGDRIRYTLTVRNTGTSSQNGYVISDNISDILEYARMINTGGGTVTSGVISYPAVDISAGQSVSRIFEVEVRAYSAWPSGGDLRITNVFGNRIDIDLVPSGGPLPPVRSAPLAPLAKVGATLNMVFGLFFLFSSFYLYTREKLLLRLALLSI